MKKTSVIFVAAVAASFVAALVVAQPVPPPGLKKVVHDSTMKGSGTTPAPLGLAFCSANQVWAMNGGGTAWACTPIGGTNTGSLSVTTSAFPGSTTNLSTVGTFDWYWLGPGGPSVPVPSWANQATTVFHWKKGGTLFKSLTWFGAGASSAPSTFPGTTTFTSTTSDDSDAAALSATDGSYFIVSGAAGYQINTSASPTSRTLRLYVGAKGVTTTIAVSLDDASATPTSTTYNAASGVNVQQTVDIVFQSATPTQLRVIVSATTLNGGVQAEEFWGMAEF